MTEPILKLNLTTNRYEGFYIVEVEEEILRRAFFRYIEENNVDLTNPEALQDAINTVARVGRWFSHARTVARPAEKPAPALDRVSPLATPQMEPKPARVIPRSDNPLQRPEPALTPIAANLTHNKLRPAEAKVLREKALDLSVDQWETLCTPLLASLPPEDASAPAKVEEWKRQREIVYRIRHAEKAELEALKSELEPAQPVTLEAVAGAINGNRLK